MEQEPINWILVLEFSLVHAVGLGHAVHALMHVRTPQGTFAWILALLVFPWASVPLYWVFGRTKFIGYRKGFIEGNLPLDLLARKVYDSLRIHGAPAQRESLWGRSARIQEKLMGLPATTGNSARLLIDGAPSFEAIFAAIESARSYLIVQFFIIREDRLGLELQKRLIEKARAGVRVYVLFDTVGSHSVSRKYWNNLLKENIQVQGFRTTRGRGNRFQLNFRNHRKLVIADGKIALTGGLNIGTEYLGENRRFGFWRDTFLEISGPSVQALQFSFCQDWFWATDEIPEFDWTAHVSETTDQIAAVLPTGPIDEIDACSLAMLQLIQSAKENLWLASPYLVPDATVVYALQLAALRGVDVRILIPKNPDHYLPYLSSFSYYQPLESCGVKIYRYREGFMHQKVMLVDAVAASVGSVNLDFRSFHLNFELGVLIFDDAFALEVKAMLEKDFALADQVFVKDFKSKPFWFHLAVRSARLLSPEQ